MMSGLRVRPIPSQNTGQRDVRFERLVEKEGENGKFLPIPPFSMNVVGRIGSGKTSFVYSLLDTWFENYWDVLVVYTGTKDSNDNWKDLHQREVVVRNHWDADEFRDWIRAIEEEQMDREHKGKIKRRYCVVLDDMIARNILKPNTGTLLEDVLLNLRHYNLTVLITTQSYKKLSKTARINALYQAIFEVHKVEIEGFAAEASQRLDKDVVIALYNYVMSAGPVDGDMKPFMIVDVNAAPGEHFRQGMKTILRVDETTKAPAEGEALGIESAPQKAPAPKRRKLK